MVVARRVRKRGRMERRRWPGRAPCRCRRTLAHDHGRLEPEMRVRAKSQLASFLSPRSIAIIGASPDAQKIRGALLQRLRHNGFPGEILPVNPSYDEIAGLRCYPNLAGIDGGADLAIIAIPAASVIPALEECAAARVRNAVIISSGFAE